MRGLPAINTSALAERFVRFSRIVIEQPWIKEIEINPLLATASGFRSLDARVIVHDQSTTEDMLVRPAIRPYPVQYAKSWIAKDGVVVAIRPIRPEDEERMTEFHSRLSETTVYHRYFHHLKLENRIEHTRLSRICF